MRLTSHLSGLVSGALALSVEGRSGQVKDRKISTCCFSS